MPVSFFGACCSAFFLVLRSVCVCVCVCMCMCVCVYVYACAYACFRVHLRRAQLVFMLAAVVLATAPPNCFPHHIGREAVTQASRSSPLVYIHNRHGLCTC